ncbi:MAG: hypothetical protein J6Z34_02490, partial [Clostridia bacterium]|nr:hypothetical protein [Clostridia bacterium]
LENLKMNPYDRVFVQRNGCTPVVVQIALSGSDLKSEGTINVTLTRDVYKEEPYNVPNYFTSVVKFTCVKGKSIYSENIPSLFESVARIANGASLSEPVNVSVFKNAGTNDAVRSFYTDITTHTEKHDELTFEIEYTASDFNGNVLNLYLYFDYDKNLIEEFVDNNIYGDISIDEVEVSAENDLLSVSAKPKKNEGGNR